MKRLLVISMLLLIASAFAAVAVLSDSAMSAWPFVAEVTPSRGDGAIYEFAVPLQVMDKARDDLADLRLYDATGHEVPYAVHVRRELEDAREVGGSMFNHAAVGNASEVSVDLGETGGEHNEIDVETAGTNFRRAVTVEGSENARDWKVLTTGNVIFSFTFNNTAQSGRVRYPTSRYRYLRVRVSADERVDKQPPAINNVRVRLASRETRAAVTWQVGVPSYQLLRHEGAPASSWTIDLGSKVPCDQLLITTEDQSFSRPFKIEVVDDPQNPRVIASGELSKSVGDRHQVTTITFDNEEHARKLRLIVNDYNNPTLSITSMQASAPLRELYFELKEPATQPLKLYFGNPNAETPRYDFEKELSAKLRTSPVPAAVGSFIPNADYQPPRLPFTERVPWLIYLVLTISSVALALILFSLARATMRLDNSEEQSAQP